MAIEIQYGRKQHRGISSNAPYVYRYAYVLSRDMSFTRHHQRQRKPVIVILTFPLFHLSWFECSQLHKECLHDCPSLIFLTPTISALAWRKKSVKDSLLIFSMKLCGIVNKPSSDSAILPFRVLLTALEVWRESVAARR